MAPTRPHQVQLLRSSPLLTVVVKLYVDATFFVWFLERSLYKTTSTMVLAPVLCSMPDRLHHTYTDMAALYWHNSSRSTQVATVEGEMSR